MYEFTGKVKRIGETKVFANNFTKRELVVTESGGGEWPNVVGFWFKRAACGQLDALSVGDEVKIGFVIDGREWTDPKTNAVRCFSDLTALKLEVVSATKPSQPDVGNAASDASDEEYPF